MFDFGGSDTERKLRALANAYKNASKTRHLAASVRKQHESMFGLTAFSDEAGSHSIERSRSGLIITEKLLGVLDFNGIGSRFEHVLRENPLTANWATLAQGEWEAPSAERDPGRWWPIPVLVEVMKYPSSTLRTVLIGLQAMQMVEKRPSLTRPNPKSRAKVVRITDRGVAFFAELKG